MSIQYTESPYMHPIHQQIKEKYPNMDFKIRKNGTIRVNSDPDLAERMKSWKPPYNEVWNYANQLEMREKRLNKRIKEAFSAPKSP